MSFRQSACGRLFIRLFVLCDWVAGAGTVDEAVMRAVALPSPITTNGAQLAGCAASGPPDVIIMDIARRRASARPIDLSTATAFSAFVMRATVLSESTAQ